MLTNKPILRQIVEDYRKLLAFDAFEKRRSFFVRSPDVLSIFLQIDAQCRSA